MPMPRRYIKQILGADDRGGRKAASRISQRAVARGVMRTLRGRAADVSGAPRPNDRDQRLGGYPGSRRS